VVEKIPADRLGTWIINGKEVSVAKDTIIDEEHGKPVVGAYVEVKANYSRGIYSAKKIEVKRGPR
jgi:protocatechuate 3,4-dioxygenase beta subunit